MLRGVCFFAYQVENEKHGFYLRSGLRIVQNIFSLGPSIWHHYQIGYNQTTSTTSMLNR